MFERQKSSCIFNSTVGFSELYCVAHARAVCKETIAPVSQITKQDTRVELETYKQSRQGLDEMYSDVWKQLKEEKKVRLVSSCCSRQAGPGCLRVYEPFRGH